MTVDREESVAVRARRLLDAAHGEWGPLWVQGPGGGSQARMDCLGREVPDGWGLFREAPQAWEVDEYTDAETAPATFSLADAEFIAAAPELVRSLLIERDELRAEVQKAYRLGEEALLGVLKERDALRALVGEACCFDDGELSESWLERAEARLGEQEGTNP